MLLRVIPLFAALTLILAPASQAVLVSSSPKTQVPAFLEDNSEARIGLLCHNDPVNHVDPLGLLTLTYDPSYQESDRATVQAAFDLGVTTARGSQLNADTRTILIQPTDSGHATGRTENTIFLNPRDRIFLDAGSRRLYEQKYRNELPPQDAKGRAIVLFHEIGHVVTGEPDEHEGGRNVRMNENPVRGGLGVPDRRQYSGHPFSGPSKISAGDSNQRYVTPLGSHIPRLRED